MPKTTWNINDFSGGVNNIVEPRDLNDNECTRANDLVAYNPGALKLEGYFQFYAHTKNVIGPSDHDNLFTFMAPYGFLIYGRAIVTRIDISNLRFQVLTSEGATGGIHGMNVNVNNGNIISIYKLSQATGTATAPPAGIYAGSRHNVLNYSTNQDEFKVYAGDHGVVGESWDVEYIVNGNFDTTMPGFDSTVSPSGSLSPYAFDANTNVNYVLNCSPNGEFGFYNITTTGNWYGSGFGNPSAPQLGTMGVAPYLFDICNTWDWFQPHVYNTFTGMTGSGINDSAMIRHAFYHDGVFRAMPVVPNYFYANHCMRPVGLYYIDTHLKFGQPGATTNKPKLYHGGWYPLRSHILSPMQIGRTWDKVDKDVFQHSDETNYGNNAGITEKITDSYITADTMYINSNSVTKPNAAGFFGLAVNATDNVAGGLWDFSNATSGAHANLKFGVSLLYDDIDEFGQQQESNIDPLQETITLTTGSNCALNICLILYKGNFSNTEGWFAGRENETSQADVGFLTDTQDGNPNAWNPRIVGANIYILRMGTREGSGGDTDESIKTLDDPLYLATFNFYGDDNKHGLSKAMDGTLASKWPDTYDVKWSYQAIRGIKDIPIERFSAERQIGAYRHDECMSVWYKTSTIINNRLYAGDVSYFSDTKPANDTGDIFYKKPEHHPDHILVSPVGKLDTLPTKSPLQMARLDGQQIIELESYGPFLFVFKSNDLVIIDPTGSPNGNEAIYQTFYGQGITSNQQTVKAPEGIYYINKRGLYLCNGEENINLGINKFDQVTWNKIVSNQSKLMYVPEYELLFITTNFTGKLNNTDGTEISSFFDNIVYYNIYTQAFFFKHINSLTSITETSNLSNGVTINGSLFVTHNLHTSTTFGTTFDEMIVTELNQFAAGNIATTSGAFFTKSGGALYASSENELNWQDGIAEAGQLSQHIDFIKFRKDSDSKWYSFNAPSGELYQGLEPSRRKTERENPLILPHASTTVYDNFLATQAAINLLETVVCSDGTEYEIDCSQDSLIYDYTTGLVSNIRFRLTISSTGPQRFDSASNFEEVDLSSAIGAPYSPTIGNAIAFAAKGDDRVAADDGLHITTGTSTTKTITVYTDYSFYITNSVSIGVTAHGYGIGDSVTITGSTNYNGTFRIILIRDADRFVINHAWDGNDGSSSVTYNDAQLQVGNLATSLTDYLGVVQSVAFGTNTVDAVTPELYQFKVSIKRNDSINNNAQFKLIIKWTDGIMDYTGSNASKYIYITGSNNMFNASGYTWLDDTVSDGATRNDAVITNFRNALDDGTIQSAGYIPLKVLSDWFTISNVQGTSGSKYFFCTLKNSNPNIDNPDQVFEVESAVIQGDESEETLSNNLLKWNNQYNANLEYNGNLEYVTKDIDFGEPGVRKKVYKAYVTYTGGGGFIECHYKANGTGTGGGGNDESNWALCNTFNASGSAATNSGRLNTSDTQTKASLTFGNGGNNVNSFQLKFIMTIESGPISNFEINDITIIYRLKNPI